MQTQSLNHISFDEQSQHAFDMNSGQQPKDLSSYNDFMNQWTTKLNNLKSNFEDVKQTKMDIENTIKIAQKPLKPQRQKENIFTINNSQICTLSLKESVDKLEQQQNTQENYEYAHEIKYSPLTQSIEHIVNETTDSQEFQIPLINMNIKPIAQFLIDNFLDLGIYDNQTLLQQLQSMNAQKCLLNKFGIDKVGHQKRILAQLEEDQGMFSRKGIITKLSQVQEQLPNLYEWLESINMIKYLSQFESAGYETLEYLIYIQQSSFALSVVDLRNELQIDKEQCELLSAHLTIMCHRMSTYDIDSYLQRKHKSQFPIQCQLPQVINNQKCTMF